jgi:hypothetical protein
MDILLQKVKQFFKRVQKCFEGLKMRQFGKKSAARKKEQTVMRYRWYLMGFTGDTLLYVHVRVLVPRIVYYWNVVVFCK